MKSFKSKTIDGFAEIALQQYQLKKIKAGSACCPDGGGDQPPPPPETTKSAMATTPINPRFSGLMSGS